MEKESLILIEVIVGSLVISPIVSKEENIKMFNAWLEELYEI